MATTTAKEKITLTQIKTGAEYSNFFFRLFSTDRSTPGFDVGKQVLLRIYEGLLLTQAVVSLLYMRATKAGSISAVAIHLPANVTSTVIFNVRKNNVALFAGASRPTIVAGQSSVVSLLSVSVVKGDVITLDLDEPGTSGVPAPVSWMVDIS